MTEKDKLTIKLKDLYQIHYDKCEARRKLKGDPPEVGYVTLELFKIGSLIPDMMRLDIKPEDYIPSGHQPSSAYDTIF